MTVDYLTIFRGHCVMISSRWSPICSPPKTLRHSTAVKV